MILFNPWWELFLSNHPKWLIFPWKSIKYDHFLFKFTKSQGIVAIFSNLSETNKDYIENKGLHKLFIAIENFLRAGSELNIYDYIAPLRINIAMQFMTSSVLKRRVKSCSFITDQINSLKSLSSSTSITIFQWRGKFYFRSIRIFSSRSLLLWCNRRI